MCAFHHHPLAPADASAQTLASVADSLACALLLLSADGSLLHANQAGRTLLQRGQWLRLETLPDRQRVNAQGAAATRQLQQALAGAAAGTRQHLALPPPLQPARAVISRLPPLPASGHDGRATQAPLALLLLMVSAGAGETGAPVDISGFAEHHGLTSAETRVLARLARGDSAAAAATALGLGVSTVRTQIGSLRRKTGHHSQAALAQALAALPPLGPGAFRAVG